MGWLKNLLFGPVQAVSDVQSVPPQAQSPERARSDQKIVPNVTIARVESHLSGDMRHIEVWVHVRNDSNVEVEVTRVNFWRQHATPGRYLEPGESYEIRIFSGDTRHDDAEQRCEVHFRHVETGDYFRADHRVDYRFEETDQGKFYIPEEMHLISPIRDI